jgi:hypothetical protein
VQDLRRETAHLKTDLEGAHAALDQAAQAVGAEKVRRERVEAALSEAIVAYESIARDNYEGTKHMIGARKLIERWRAVQEGLAP